MYSGFRIAASPVPVGRRTVRRSTTNIMTNIDFPASTGQAARFLKTTEPRLAETVRRRKVAPEPPIIAGRRLWGPDHLLQAAEALGVLTDRLREKLETAASRRFRSPSRGDVAEDQR
jgi:hypothetical protein